jgi:hypothetical protein
MPRRTARSANRSSKYRPKRSKQFKTSSPRALSRKLRVGWRQFKSKLRDLVIGFGLITALSLVPPSATEQWVPNAQRAAAVAYDIRMLVFDIALDTGTLILDAGSKLLRDILPNDL